MPWGDWFDSEPSACRIEEQAFLIRQPVRAAATIEVHLPSWRNWQTRMVQVHVPATVWGFESLRWHHSNKLEGTFGVLRGERSGFRLRAPAALTSAKRLKFESLRWHQAVSS